MAKHGIGSFLPLLAIPAALATGGLLAPALFGGEAAAGAAGAGAGLAGAGEAAVPAALSAGTDLAAPALASGLSAGDILAAPTTAGLAATEAATPLAATAPAVAGLTSEAISGLPSAVSGLSDVGGALPSAATAGGAALPGSSTVLGPSAADLATGSNLLTATLDPATAAGVADPAAAAGGINPAVGPGAFDTGTAGLGGDPGVSFASMGDSSGGGGGFLSDAWDQLKKNPMALAGLGGLGAALLMNRGAQIPGSGPVTATATGAQTNAGQLMAQANQNITAPITGALPPGTLDAINSAANAQKAEVRSSFAQMGIPAGSSMEAEALAGVDRQAGETRLKAMTGLANLGIQEANAGLGQEQIASNDFITLMNAQIRRDEALQQALARFAGAAAGPSVGSIFNPNNPNSQAAA